MAFETPDNGLSNDKLKWGVWWVEHKLQLKSIGTVLLGVVGFSMLGYGLYGFADWMFGSGVRERQQIAQLAAGYVDYSAFRQARAPHDLGVEDTIVLQGGSGRYDFAARLTDPNAQWWAEFSYRFGEDATAQPKRGYILPGESKYLLALGVKSDSRPSAAGLVVEDIRWHRVNGHATRPDYATWSSTRLNFGIADIAFATPKPDDPLGVSRATFTFTNDTAFGYHAVAFSVALISGGRVVGVNTVTISDVRAGETRLVAATWFSDLPSVSKVEVHPEVNIFDARSYLGPGE